MRGDAWNLRREELREAREVLLQVLLGGVLLEGVLPGEEERPAEERRPARSASPTRCPSPYYTGKGRSCCDSLCRYFKTRNNMTDFRDQVKFNAVRTKYTLMIISKGEY